MQVIYVESDLKSHPRVQRILKRFENKSIVIECDNYREVFNPRSQNFRVQKKNPALILARKTGKLVLPTPEGFGIGGSQNYYFSHLLNCLYDCRYCFLQGMYPSANYVLFVNYEDFMQDIADRLKNSSEQIYFFSGYDSDSLAYEPVSGFLKEFIPFFSSQPNGILEIRTKSANVQSLLGMKPLENAVIAFSFTPSEISEKVEHKVPSVEKRIEALCKLAEQGWRIGLRLDPLIYATNFEKLYKNLIDTLFDRLPRQAVHSVSVGPLRFPVKMYQKLSKLYPEEKLLAHPLVRRKNNFTYESEIEAEMKNQVLAYLTNYLPKPLIFECQS